jgi:gamma-glutamylcyclotransferase (GGCT)/AIG2-like uncharacterized protein YtfP
MKLFVYGTLKKGGVNHYSYLQKVRNGKSLSRKEATFLQHYKLKHHALVDFGHGFPYMIPAKNHCVYGEIYEVDEKTIKRIDVLEGVPSLYERKLANVKINNEMELAGMYYYLSNMTRLGNTWKMVKNGYWDLKTKVKYKMLVDGKKKYDTPDKIVFDMRFFDGDRTPTNKSYMEMVKARSKKDLDTSNEHIFLMDCIDLGIVKEWL